MSPVTVAVLAAAVRAGTPVLFATLGEGCSTSGSRG